MTWKAASQGREKISQEPLLANEVSSPTTLLTLVITQVVNL
jgi:hypothetical protein